MRAAWSENLILEKYYAPVLDTPSYISKTGHRWPAGQRTDAELRIVAAPGSSDSYESRADATEGRHFIRVWPPVAFWIIVVVSLSGLLATCFQLS